MELEPLNSPPPPSTAPERPSPPAAKRSRGTKWLVLLLIAVGVIAADQATKHWAQQELQLEPGRRIQLIEGYLSFSYVRNPGAAWGFLARSNASFRRPFFIGISLVAMLFILYLFIRLEPGQRLLLVALSLVMGGAIGNFIDRVRFNYVVDFIDFHIKQKFKWPTFNVADVAITIGVALLFAEMFIVPVLQRRKAHREAEMKGTDPADNRDGA
jgi:signal peptidase II